MYLPGKKNRHIPVVIEFGTYLTRAGYKTHAFNLNSKVMLEKTSRRQLFPLYKNHLLFIELKDAGVNEKGEYR